MDHHRRVSKTIYKLRDLTAFLEIEIDKRDWSKSGMNQLRDFIYMDLDRVRSLASQLFEGVPEVLDSKSGKEQDIAGKATGKIPFLANGELKGNLLFRQEKTETKSLQHYIYILLENKLEELGKLIILNDRFSQNDWISDVVRDNLKQTDIIKVTAYVEIFDYEYVDNFLNIFKDLPETVAECSSIASGTISKKQAKKDALKQMGAKDWKNTINPISKLINTMYKGIISLKIYPLGTEANPFLLGRLNKDYLQYDREMLLFQYGTRPSQKWTIVGQISSIPNKKEDNLEQPELNEEYNMLDIELMLRYIIDIAISCGLKFSVSYPSIGIIPLAIYRSH